MEELSKLEKNGYQRPTFELDNSVLKTTLFTGSSSTITSDVKDLKGSKELIEHKTLTSAKYVELTGVSERTARRHLNDLVKAGKAQKSGDGPATEYRLIE